MMLRAFSIQNGQEEDPWLDAGCFLLPLFCSIRGGDLFPPDAYQALHFKFGIQKIRMPVSRRPISISRSKQIAANVRTVISEAPIPRTIIAHSSVGIIANLHSNF